MDRHDKFVEGERTVSKLRQWAYELVGLFLIGYTAFWIDVFSGAIDGMSIHFRTTDVYGMTFWWTPGVLYGSAVMVAYLVGYRDILALRESNDT